MVAEKCKSLNKEMDADAHNIEWLMSYLLL